MQPVFSAAEIAAIVEPRSAKGATNVPIHGLAALRAAQVGELSFLGNAKYKAEVASSAASIILLPTAYEGEPQAGQLFLFVDNPSAALARVCARIERQLWPQPKPGVHASAVVAPGAHIAATATVGPLCVIEEGVTIGERVHLQAQVFVGRNARIGDDCWLMPGVVVATECILQERVRLHSGVVVGSDGYGYEFAAGRHEKVPQVGIVVIERDVEIGANTTLDRARFSRTVVGEGTKIDNLVQVAHNVVIGRHCLLCAQVGISGSTTLGDYVIMGGQSGAAGHLMLGSGSKIDGGSGVTASLSPGSFVKGSPCLPYQLEQRINVLRQRLPALFRHVGEIDAEIARLKKSSAP
jgi:UDP-3-O-[3-hydroxymyristoyl] glucosamine N-acyltransferase